MNKKINFENLAYLFSSNTLKDDGHLIFHDSCIAREGATGRPEVMKFMKEVKFKKLYEIGSVTHFIKKTI